MKTLPETFGKNGLHYQLIRRTDRVVLYQLLFDGECVGWEVARIFIQREHILNGHTIQAAEVLPSNEKFGTEGLKTKSQAFHANSRIKAETYFTELSERLKNANVMDGYEK